MRRKYWHWVSRGGRLLKHKPHRFILLLRLVSWTIALSALTKLWSLPQVLQWMAAPQISAGVTSPHELVALVDRLLRLNRWMFTPTCWKRAILLHRGLALHGISTNIVFGVRKGEGGLLEGHAWVEAQGQPMYEAKLPAYVRTLVFP